MDNPTTASLSADPPSDQDMAAALDAALDALQAGRPLDRAALLARHPSLGPALTALDQLFAPTSAGGSARPEEPALARPHSIGPYQIERELGAGGFGVVYLAYDPDVRRRVAVKILHPGRLDQPEALLRFQREAQATGRLCHPGIVRLFDYSRSGPPYYLVTEYVAGVDPREWCRQRDCAATEVAEVVARIADAVEYAHQQGVCHRDLKPGNVLIDPTGQPHVLDFGLARLLALDGVTLSAATGDGHVLGSLPYMPPEQASGHSHIADARSDVYSLGVILYELLTGRLPFEGPAHTLPARVQEEDPPPPRCLNPRVPPDLEAVCLMALARRPQDRYASAAELADDLRAFLDKQPVRARRPTLLGRVRRVLGRRHLDTLWQGWTLLLLLLGAIILVGCVVCNRLMLVRPAPQQHWWGVLLVKAVQVAVMVGLVVRLRPRPLDGQPPGHALTAAERQIWSLVPGYYGSFLVLVLLNRAGAAIPLAPVLSVLSGMGFATLGATIWGWAYGWAVGFMLLAGLIVLAPNYGMTLLGLGWFVCLAVGSVHLHWTR